MGTNENIKAFFENPFTEEYLRFCSSIIRQNITSISVACDLIESAEGSNEKSDRSEQVGAIIANCRDLMRTVSLSELLTSKTDDLIYIDTDVFIGEFVAGCRNAVGSDVTLKIGERAGGYVQTNENMLRYLLLAFIRRVLTCSSRPNEITIGSSLNNDGKIKLCVRMDTNAVSDDSGTPIFGGAELTEVIAERIGLAYESGDDYFSVIFNKKKEFSDPVFECRPYCPSDGTFSAYNIMLVGMNDFSTENLF